MPVHKSAEGQRRLKENIAKRRGVREAMMTSSVAKPKKKIVASEDAARDHSVQPRFRNRRRVVAPEGKFF